MRTRLSALAGIAALSLTACGMPKGSTDPWVGFGPNPPQPKPATSLLPMIGIPQVVGWPEGATPISGSARTSVHGLWPPRGVVPWIRCGGRPYVPRWPQVRSGHMRVYCGEPH